MVQAYNPGSWELEAMGSGVQGYPRLFEASLNYIRPCLKNFFFFFKNITFTYQDQDAAHGAGELP